ncbi:MAG: DnaA/Hda family protein [Pseudomonadota bacterium]
MSSDPNQLTLAIDRPHQQRLDNFVVGDNAELLQALKQVNADFSAFWIFGATGSGRSHLLRGCCHRSEQVGEPVTYVGCADYLAAHGALDADALLGQLRHAAGYGQLVAVDDVQWILGRGSLEEMLLAVYQRLLHSRGRLLVSHTQPATATDFAMADLNSRMRSLMHFHISPLNDSHKAELLRARADSRGYELSHSVLNYWLSRGPRDIGALLRDLDVLDRASLVHKQRVTVPLLKQVLGY